MIAVLAVTPLYGAVERIGGPALVLALAVAWSLVVFCAAYWLAIRFRVDSDRASIFTESLLSDLDG